ncbi:MAG: thiamine-phosphate kinase [Verrucomicrobiota bacterium]
MHDEDSLIDLLLQAWPPTKSGVGPGDDCAVVSAPPKGYQTVLKTDCIVESIHFIGDTRPQLIGRKAIARAISDFAAMGAHPTHALITLGLTADWQSAKKLKALYSGMRHLASPFGIDLAGGELTQAKQFWISVSMIGHIHPDRMKLRSSAQPGDLILVTGKLGGSFPKRHLTFEPRLEEGQWLANQSTVHAMMDLSDGLGKDLPRLASASQCSFEIHADQIPKNRVSVDQAVNDGEDYELLFSVSPRGVNSLLRRWPFDTPVSPIGTMLPPEVKPNTDGLLFSGFDHLRRKSND